MSGTPCKRVAENRSGSSAATRQRRAPPRRAGPIAAFPAAGDFGCNLAAEMLPSPGPALASVKEPDVSTRFANAESVCKQDRSRRRIPAADLFGGHGPTHTKLKSTVEFCAYAQQCMRQVFGDQLDPRLVHTVLPVEEFVQKVSILKAEFTNSMASKEHIRNFLDESRTRPRRVFFRRAAFAWSRTTTTCMPA